jgi:uncharacterized protein
MRQSQVAFTLTDEEKKILLHTARAVIAEKLGLPAAVVPAPTEILKTNCGAFVSLHREGNLRGCIGLIAAQKPLIDTVREMAQAAAFSDPRFRPLTADELQDTEIEISVLSPFRKITDLGEIVVGTHGLYVRRGFQSGLLLPQVAVEYGWDRNEFLSQTCVKAGLPAQTWRKGGVDVELFSAIVFDEADSAHR